MFESLFGNSKEPFAKMIENGISSVLSPLFTGAKNMLVYCYEQFPFLSAIGTTLALVIGYFGINGFRTKSKKERESAKERNLDEIPGIRVQVVEARREIANLNGAMTGASASALANSNATLGFSNTFRDILERLGVVQRTLENNGQTLGTIERTANGISRTVGVLPGYGEKLTTIEGLQRTTDKKVDEIVGHTRPRANTQ